MLRTRERVPAGQATGEFLEGFVIGGSTFDANTTKVMRPGRTAFDPPIERRYWSVATAMDSCASGSQTADFSYRPEAVVCPAKRSDIQIAALVSKRSLDFGRSAVENIHFALSRRDISCCKVEWTSTG
jgi:hypothetical protein